MSDSLDERDRQYRQLIELGIALSSERSTPRLLEKILTGAKDLARAEGGTLYLATEKGDALNFRIMLNDTLGIRLGTVDGAPVTYAPVPLLTNEGRPNNANVSAHAAISKRLVNIADAYDADGFDFTGTKAFDALTGYRSVSILCVPMTFKDGTVMGVLQLLNARDQGGAIIPFSTNILPLIEALASQAAVAYANQTLVEAQRVLFKSFIGMIAGAIDAKSAFTGEHCRRVPALAEMLTRAATEARSGPFADFSLTEEEWDELEVAAGLHDCGKVTTPEYIVDKATKLETINNRIHEIRTRFEVLKRDAEIAYWKAVANGADATSARAGMEGRLKALDDDFAFVAECNLGTEEMAPEKIARLAAIAGQPWLRTLDDRLGLSWQELQRFQKAPPAPLPVNEPLLADRPEHLIPFDKPPPAANADYGFRLQAPTHRLNLGEIYNLSIGRGTLTAEERFHINDHIVQTIVMLKAMPFPPHLRQVPEWAGGHHERMDGKGYPLGLAAHQLSIPARIMAIADIFEALTAKDRPYRTPKSLSQTIAIMARMRDDGHIDPDLFALFLTAGVHLDFARQFLAPEQIDAVDIARHLRGAEKAASLP